MLTTAGIAERRLALFPQTTAVIAGGDGSVLAIGGCNLAELAVQHGTPCFMSLTPQRWSAAADRYAAALEVDYPRGRASPMQAKPFCAGPLRSGRSGVAWWTAPVRARSQLRRLRASSEATAGAWRQQERR